MSDSNLWSSSLCKSRKEDALLRILRIGHCQLIHRYLLSHSAASFRDKCNIQLSIAGYLLLECPSLSPSNADWTYQNTLALLFQNDETTVQKLLQVHKYFGVFNIEQLLPLANQKSETKGK